MKFAPQPQDPSHPARRLNTPKPSNSVPAKRKKRNTPSAFDSQLITDSNSFEDKPPEQVLEWAIRKYHPKIAIASSFSVEDTIVIHMATKIQPDIKIFYLNTGFQFKETDDTKDLLTKKYSLNIIEYSPKLSMEEQTRQYGEKLYETKPNLCCKLRKVEPIKRALKELDAWVTGMRREQAPTRRNMKVVEINMLDNGARLVKVNPLASWSVRDVWKYITDHKIPYNPLYNKGYASIGCQPCTRPVKPGEDYRAGRWSGRNKVECGIHTFTAKPKKQNEH